MKFRLLKTFILSQLLILGCSSYIYSQDTIPSDTTNIYKNTNAVNDSNSQMLCNMDQQSSSKDANVDNIGGIPVNNILFTLCFISIIFSFIAILISLKRRSNYDNDYEYDENTPHNKYDKWVESCKKNTSNLSSLANRVISLEKQIKRLEDLSTASNRWQVDCTSNDNSNNSNVKTQTHQYQNPNQTQKKTKGDDRPDTRVYQWLKVVDGGRLALVDSSESAYYRAWTSNNGIIYFEFYCSRPGKAINNRTSLIEPFCEIQKGDIEPDSAKGIVIKKQGVLNNDYSINSKVVIQYS
jgi:hypothetical protein